MSDTKDVKDAKQGGRGSGSSPQDVEMKDEKQSKASQTKSTSKFHVMTFPARPEVLMTVEQKNYIDRQVNTFRHGIFHPTIIDRAVATFKLVRGGPEFCSFLFYAFRRLVERERRNVRMWLPDLSSQDIDAKLRKRIPDVDDKRALHEQLVVPGTFGTEGRWAWDTNALEIYEQQATAHEKKIKSYRRIGKQAKMVLVIMNSDFTILGHAYLEIAFPLNDVLAIVGFRPTEIEMLQPSVRFFDLVDCLLSASCLWGAQHDYHWISIDQKDTIAGIEERLQELNFAQKQTKRLWLYPIGVLPTNPKELNWMRSISALTTQLAAFFPVTFFSTGCTLPPVENFAADEKLIHQLIERVSNRRGQGAEDWINPLALGRTERMVSWMIAMRRADPWLTLDEFREELVKEIQRGEPPGAPHWRDELLQHAKEHEIAEFNEESRRATQRKSVKEHSTSSVYAQKQARELEEDRLAREKAAREKTVEKKRQLIRDFETKDKTGNRYSRADSTVEIVSPRQAMKFLHDGTQDAFEISASDGCIRFTPINKYLVAVEISLQPDTAANLTNISQYLEIIKQSCNCALLFYWGGSCASG